MRNARYVNRNGRRARNGTEAFTDRYGRYVTIARIRQVWAEVTKTPCASIAELSARLGWSSDRGSPSGGVAIALRFLRDAGYIAFDDGAERGRAIIVPFYQEDL